MDIEPLKAVIGDEKFALLRAFVDDLTGQRDAARNESITGRKGMKDKLAKLEADQAALLEKLGLESLDDLTALPDARGAAEAAKQYETKLKRMERQLAEATTGRDEAQGKYRSSLQKATIAEALAGHKFVARDIVESYISARLAWEGDELLYKTDDGKLIPVRDGVAGVAKSRPELLEPIGTGGAGVRQSNAGSGGGAKTVTRAQFDSMDHGARASFSKEGGSVIDA